MANGLNLYYGPSNVTFNGPNVTYNGPNVTFNGPNVTFNGPNGTYNGPNGTYNETEGEEEGSIRKAHPTWGFLMLATVFLPMMVVAGFFVFCAGTARVEKL